MTNFFKTQKENIIIFVAYAISFGLILFNRGLYLDDWVLFGVDKETVIKMFQETGSVWFGYLHYFLLSLPFGLFLYKLLIFLLYLSSAYLFKSVLKNIQEINKTGRFFLVLFFALLPLNFARIAIICFPYTLAYFLFFLGFFLVAKYLQKRILIYRFLSLAIFFISFTTNSFLVFYFLVISYIIYIEKIKFQSWKELVKKIWQYADFIIIPFIFWGLKNIFFQPSGGYAYYNQISWSNFENALDITLKNFYHSSITFLGGLFHPTVKDLPILFIVLIVGFLFYKIIKFIGISYDKKSTLNWPFFFLGLLALGLALLPYLAVGLVPTFFEWTSRHFLLAPLGLSFMIYYGLRVIFQKIHLSESTQNFIYCLIVIVFMLINFSVYFNFQKDWFKQLALIENFRSSKIIEDNKTFLFIEKTSDWNAIQRNYRFYEFNALMKESFGNEKRFGILESDFQPILSSFSIAELNNYRYFKMSDYQKADPQYKIILEAGSFPLTNKNTLKLFWERWFQTSKFQEHIKEVIILEYNTL